LKHTASSLKTASSTKIRQQTVDAEATKSTFSHSRGGVRTVRFWGAIKRNQTFSRWRGLPKTGRREVIGNAISSCTADHLSMHLGCIGVVVVTCGEGRIYQVTGLIKYGRTEGLACSQAAHNEIVFIKTRAFNVLTRNSVVSRWLLTNLGTPFFHQFPYLNPL
jgi:hypothetical protein